MLTAYELPSFILEYIYIYNFNLYESESLFRNFVLMDIYSFLVLFSF